MTLVLVAFVLLATAPLLWQEAEGWAKLKPLLIAEFKIQLEALGINGFIGTDMKTAMDAVVKKRSEDEATAREESYKDEMRTLFKDTSNMVTLGYGSGVEYSPIMLHIKQENLSKVRAMLREHFGEWSDKADAMSVGKQWKDDYSEQVQMLSVTYKSNRKDPYYDIRTNYLIADIPKGLLKPGCEIKTVEHEEEFELSCAI